MSRKYDLIIFGATGFTGKYCIEDIVKTQREKHSPLYENLTWAVAGRSEDKLELVLQKVSNFTGVDVSRIDKIIADVSSLNSLRQMASQCSVVVNCVGPYRFYGEDVVRACILEKTSHVDISGEQQFLERIQIKYHKEAESSGVYIIGTCGFGSIPADCGVTYLYQRFDGDINSVESFFETDSYGKRIKFHYGTYHSVIHILAHLNEIRDLQGTLLSKRVPKSNYETAKWSPIHYTKVINGWVSVYSGPDPQVVKRSQYHFYTEEHRRPIQYNPYVKLPGFFNSLLLGIGAAIFFLLCQFRLGVYLLETFPRLFTLGVVSHAGPTREEAESLDFKYTMIASGWKEKTSGPSDHHNEPPNKTLTLEIRGKNPIYSASAAMMIEAAITIAFEKDKLPSTGGVFTPGVAFEKTTLIDRLNSKGITFQIVEVEA